MSTQILFPLVQGCETREPKIVHMCLSTMQKLILAKVRNTVIINACFGEVDTLLTTEKHF
jgi:hypothetical protein